MITIDEAKILIRENISPLKTGIVKIENCVDHVLSKDIIAQLNSPVFDNSAMDGYAVKYDDFKNFDNDNGKKLKLISESKAGTPSNKILNSGETIKISTGGMIPIGADSIIPVENTEIDKDNFINFLKSPLKGDHIRHSGEEYKKGDILINKGEIIDPSILPIIASNGLTDIPIYLPPKIAILTTGDELKSVGESLNEGEIYESTSYTLKTLVENSKGVIKYIKKVKDSLKDTIDAIKLVENGTDIIIFSGGVSMGEHDYVKSASYRTGFEKIFWKVLQKPGKPLFFAKKGNKLLFGLPGNPASSMVSFLFYIDPLIKMLMGKKNTPHTIKAYPKEEIFNNLSRDHFLRIKIERVENKIFFTPLKGQDSYMLTSIKKGDGFIRIKSKKRLTKDNLVDIHLFPWRRLWDI